MLNSEDTFLTFGASGATNGERSDEQDLVGAGDLLGTCVLPDFVEVWFRDPDTGKVRGAVDAGREGEGERERDPLFFPDTGKGRGTVGRREGEGEGDLLTCVFPNAERDDTEARCFFPDSDFFSDLARSVFPESDKERDERARCFFTDSDFFSDFARCVFPESDVEGVFGDFPRSVFPELDLVPDFKMCSFL